MTPGMERPAASAHVSEQEFTVLYRRLRDERPWGPTDRRGALNYITRAHVLAAAGEVRSGRTVSLAAPVETQASPDNPEPSRHEMTAPKADSAAAKGLDFALDRIAMNVHGNADSHIDALCHVIFDGTLYNDISADAVTATGPRSCPSRWPAAGSSAAACCSTSRVHAGCAGSNRAIT